MTTAAPTQVVLDLAHEYIRFRIVIAAEDVPHTEPIAIDDELFFDAQPSRNVRLLDYRVAAVEPPFELAQSGGGRDPSNNVP